MLSAPMVNKNVPRVCKAEGGAILLLNLEPYPYRGAKRPLLLFACSVHAGWILTLQKLRLLWGNKIHRIAAEFAKLVEKPKVVVVHTPLLGVTATRRWRCPHASGTRGVHRAGSRGGNECHLTNSNEARTRDGCKEPPEHHWRTCTETGREETVMNRNETTHTEKRRKKSEGGKARRLCRSLQGDAVSSLPGPSIETPCRCQAIPKRWRAPTASCREQNRGRRQRCLPFRRFVERRRAGAQCRPVRVS